jgi:hypothetical protein
MTDSGIALRVASWLTPDEEAGAEQEAAHDYAALVS